MIKEIKLFTLPTPEFLVFVTLPLIAFLIAVQTIWYVLRLKKLYGKFNVYLTVNAFTAWVGNFLRNLKIVDKSIFWVWDYYPPGDPDLRIKIARFAYWKFDKASTKSSDSVIFLNKRLEILRKKINVLSKNKSYHIVPIGTDSKNISFPKNKVIGHMGVLKRSQGLELLFDNLKELLEIVPDLKIEILGSGPDEQYFKQRAKRFTNIKFHGFVEKEDEVDKIIGGWSIGLATYVPDKSNGAYWTDPSKIKAYIGQGVPVITTEITGFSEEIRTSNAGIVIDYFDSRQFIKAVVIVLSKQKKYRINAINLAKKYSYKYIYKGLFIN